MPTVTYKLDVPATPSLSDQAIQTIPVAVSASAVEAGDQLNRMKLYESAVEYERTRRLEEMGAATPDRVALTLERHFQIGCQHVQSAGQGEAPLYFLQFIDELNQKLSQIQQHITQQVQQVKQEVQQNQRETDNKLTVFDARMQNERARHINEAALSHLTLHFRKLLKERTNTGAGLPGNFAVLDAPPEIRVGEAPPLHFPRDWKELNGISHGQLDYLAKAYGEDFGIIAEDTILTRRQKFTLFITKGL